ncbi:hypothetical protein SM764_20045 [Pseudophaeobacter sp. 1A16562]|uniref:hypothetical protein n=1 Tax=unclassified Pseudophaeobacter TaxID=2637024 RepID=UPI0034D4EBA4
MDSLVRDHEQPIILDTKGARLRCPRQGNWSNLFLGDESPDYLRQREIQSFLKGWKPARVLAIGTDAALKLDRLVPGDIAPRDVLLSVEDFSFSIRNNPNKTKRFRTVLERFPRLFCEDQYQFVLASDKGSEIPHFLLDIDPREGAGVCLDPSATGIGLIRTPGVLDSHCHSVMQDVRRMLPEHYVRVIDEADLFSDDDMACGRSLGDVLQEQLGDLGALVFMGYSRNTQVLMRALGDEARLRSVAMDNFHLCNMVWDIKQEIPLCPAYGLIAALAERLQAPVNHAPFSGHGSILDQIRKAEAKNAPAFYEDLLALKQDGPLDIYFSITPVETHSRGARAQRVRNMLQALGENGRAVIDVSTASGVLERRIKLLASEIARGRALGIFYGENSTAPLDSITTLSRLSALIRMVRDQGGKTGWFIRDLHFMDADTWTSGNERDLIDRAQLEFSTLSEQMDIFYAPTDQSAAQFRSHLPQQARPQTEWKALPPGMPPLTAPPIWTGSSSAISFLYTGGLGAIYRMDTYLDAVRALQTETDVTFDFVVRAPEKHHLDEVAALSPRIRIITEDFDHYRSQARQVVGVSLLDTAYAEAAFPLKVVNYAARSVPILCFEGSAYGQFLKTYEIGWELKRRPGATAEMMQELIAQAREGKSLVPQENFRRAWEDNAWQKRAQQVLKQLSA